MNEPTNLQPASVPTEKVVAEPESVASAGNSEGVMVLSDEELDEVYGGISVNWEIDW